ncbi:DegT/DnrJ/EryC1/StrS family aminotransferase [Flammeovirga sp. MY04]|uniref:DegT/DnrJ/EryC1/StrS family aminotransferase n=1 Tax=Flammeovirga sp. MY04 TaxID=1191459 RepID=UPI0008061518|nr:DegT/DnrJ/EryC1/StrS family aminotransferase [Flammeovirga sp. MY04]ANQ48428.1 DegT/DnrJ/EryC1/StrS family aminotransferase [Flammeovirga sp. MY04]
MINVNKPFLPKSDEYQRYVDQIFNINWLTNNGPLVNEFELKIKDYLKINHFLFVSNGTIALQFAIKALDLKGEIITTPFSYVATTSSIVWEGCTPIFVDIDSKSFNINPSKIEEKINENTSAILATHVYGNPCDIDQIQEIAEKHNLKVIYDASHCFGTQYKNRSVFEYGDISTTSFHATKLLHSIEGGGVFSNDPQLIKKIASMRNFGHDGENKFSGLGINGKNSEFHAAMGLCNLNYIDNILEKRKSDSFRYNLWFDKSEDISLLKVNNITSFNYAYYPIVLKTKKICEKIYKDLKENNIYARRYFYPLLSDLDYVENSNDNIVANEITEKVLCLPLYYQLTNEEIDMIARIILRTLNN